MFDAGNTTSCIKRTKSKFNCRTEDYIHPDMAQDQSALVAQSPPSILLNILEKPNKYTCMNCKMQFESAEFQRAHFKTEWHLYNLKRKVCNLEPIDQDSFDKIQMTPSVSVNSDYEHVAKHAKAIQDLSSKDHIEEDLITIESDLDSNWEEINHEDFLDEDYDDAEAIELLSKIVPVERCLFCNKKSANIESNLDHMKSHGFFIPEEQYLTDLEGFIEYLGFKVDAGATCLWCNKQFSALHGARLHMLYKGHCKVKYDQTSAIEEFKDFYDYSSQIQIPMKPLNELSVPKKRSDRHRERQNALVATPRPNKAKQLVSHENPAVVAGTFQSKSIKNFNLQRAKKLLELGLIHNNAIRARLRRQNPM